MKKVCILLAIVSLSPLVVSKAGAGPISEGPLHWTARHVRNAAVTTANVGRNIGRRIDYRAHQVRRAL
ncbi:MAG: hypothetical protein JO333_13480 [Verrucomicrobia bacterium]|nr:hypothetical protein [Verrucomicrobiota bacterium]